MPQSNNFNNPESNNNFDLRCGEVITMRLNTNHWERSYCEYKEIEEIAFSTAACAERCWGDINQRAAIIYEKCWKDKWERTEEMFYMMEEVFNDHRAMELTLDDIMSDDEDSDDVSLSDEEPCAEEPSKKAVEVMEHYKVKTNGERLKEIEEEVEQLSDDEYCGRCKTTDGEVNYDDSGKCEDCYITVCG